MIQELSMKDENDYEFSCVVQYIIFPPHVMTNAKDKYYFKFRKIIFFFTNLKFKLDFSLSDDEEVESTEDDGEFQLISECWVEPQHGISFNCNQRNKFLEGFNYKEVSQAVRIAQRKFICDKQSILFKQTH
jgi:hypothetical protein